jgi:hypothetical protein
MEEGPQPKRQKLDMLIAAAKETEDELNITVNAEIMYNKEPKYYPGEISVSKYKVKYSNGLEEEIDTKYVLTPPRNININDYVQVQTEKYKFELGQVTGIENGNYLIKLSDNSIRTFKRQDIG